MIENLSLFTIAMDLCLSSVLWCPVNLHITNNVEMYLSNSLFLMVHCLKFEPHSMNHWQLWLCNIKTIIRYTFRNLSLKMCNYHHSVLSEECAEIDNNDDGFDVDDDDDQNSNNGIQNSIQSEINCVRRYSLSSEHNISINLFPC